MLHYTLPNVGPKYSIIVSARFYKTIILIILFCHNIKAFDPVFYKHNNPDLKDQNLEGVSGLIHYLNTGFYELRQSAASVPNTNFDWLYYKTVNKLDTLVTEEDARNHYITIGHSKGLAYCKRFTICILLHLYNLKLIDEFIDSINYFMKINPLNTFYIKINIPMDKNLDIDFKKFERDISNIRNREIQGQMIKLSPYHSNLINATNYKKLYFLVHYLQDKLQIQPQNLQIMFAENRGLDIGGFFLLLNELIAQKLPVDYVIKLHTKSWDSWRLILTSSLNLRINKLLAEKQFVYSCSIDFDWIKNSRENLKNVSRLLHDFQLPKRNFKFSAGTMFIASSNLIDFFRPYNLITLFYSLNKFNSHPKIEMIEHAYERFFGYLASHLNLNNQVIGYVPRTNDTMPYLP